MKIAVSGASGYIGIRLIPQLLKESFQVNAGVRNIDYLKTRDFFQKINVFETDFTNSKNLDNFFEGVDTAYYLIHSMNDSPNFFETEKICALNFARYAQKHGVKKIVYLGGLAKNSNELSQHLKSRIEVGKILRQNHENVIELRAGIIIGSGSASFELIRYTAERMPFIPYIEDLNYLTQPIGIRDVLSYLLLSSKKNLNNEIIEIGGPDILKYIDMIKIYCEIVGIKKTIIKCPFSNPSYCAKVLSILSPIPYNLSKSLIESLKSSSVVSNQKAKELFPEITPIDYKTQIQYALRRVIGNEVESIWTTSYIPHYIKKIRNLTETQGIIIQSYSTKINDTQSTFKKIKSIGGSNGYYYANTLWKIRAFIDKLVGGVGFRNGRRHPFDIHIGETIDFWRVENIVENKIFLLRSEMKLPGYGWLKFEIENDTLKLTAYFKPKGLLGYIYWYLLYPIHHFVFKGLIKQLSK